MSPLLRTAMLSVFTLLAVLVQPAPAQAASTLVSDVNCDGRVNIGDALVIAQYAVNNRSDTGSCPLADPITEINAARADVDQNGAVNIGDALLLAQCAVNNANVACPGDILSLRGVNIAGAEFGTEGELGELGIDYEYPTAANIEFFTDAGMNTIRVPFRWERLQRSAGAPFVAAEIAELDRVVADATARGATVILDPHNFGRYFGAPLGQAPATNAAFADLWERLATRYGDDPQVIFGLMNEPNDLSQQAWIRAANAAIAAIRDAGASNLILVSGNYFSGAFRWFETPGGDLSNAAAFDAIIDPLDNYAVEAHQYLDPAGSGESLLCVSDTIGSERLADFTDWLRSTGRRGFLGEFGTFETQVCLDALDDMLDHIDANPDVWLGWTYWAAGEMWPDDYPYGVEPSNGVSDDPQLPVLLDHLG